MRRAGLALFVVASSFGFCEVAVSQATAPGATLSAQSVVGTNSQQQFLFQTPAPTTNNFVAGLVTNKAVIGSQPVPFIILTNGAVRRLGRSLTNGLPQGLYRSEPYSMIVASPGVLADNNSITPQDVPTMRIIKPELRLVPMK